MEAKAALSRRDPFSARLRHKRQTPLDLDW